jgi:hypothetical protein
MHAREGGKGSAIIVVGFATVAILVCYWLLRVDDREENARQQSETAKNSVSAGNSGRRPSDNSQLAPRGGQPSGPAEAQVLVPQAASAHQSKNLKPNIDASPSSITYRYKAPEARMPEASTASEHTGELGNSDADTLLVKRTKTIDVHTDSNGCKLCWSSASRGIAIPRGCGYISHTLTQLYREPFAPIEQRSNEYTEYLDSLDTNANGRLEAITLSVRVEKKVPSAVNPSITMRLAVEMACPRDENVGE